jgi:putative spermidine/putrescine transport system permease protein
MRRRQSKLLPIRRAGAFALVWIMRSACLALLLVPIGLVVFLAFGGDNYTTIPPNSYSLRWFENILNKREFSEGFITSLKIALIVTPVSVIAGTGAAYTLWRRKSWASEAIMAGFMAPITLPLVVTGLAFLAFYNHIGSYYSFWNIVFAHIVMTFPYSLRAVAAVLVRYDRQLDDAAASLRASPAQAFFHVTLPIIRPGLFAGGLFAFVLSFDDFAVAVFLIDPSTRTLPIAIYQYLEWNLDPTVSAVSTVLIMLAIACVVLIERIIGLDRFIGLRR